MGSLRNIMNVDDDLIDSNPIRRDKKPGSTSALNQYSSMTIPTYNPSSTQEQRRTSPPRTPLHSSASPAGHTNPTGSRPRSNTTESMDSSYAHGQGQSHNQPNSFSGAPTRPVMPGTSVSGELPVKLTPITGRVSRAKKGVPVHTCELCQPPKTFTRAEHLRRHQLSHRPPDLACTVPGCDKSFHRKDLLERHLQRHEQDDKATKDGGQPSRPSYGSPSRHYGNSPLPPPSTFGGPSAGAGAATAREAPITSTLWSPANKPQSGRGSVTLPPLRDIHNNFHMAGVKDEYAVDPVAGRQTSDAVPRFDEARSATGLRLVNSVPDLWTDSAAAIPSSASGSTFSTPQSRPSSDELSGKLSPSPFPVAKEMHSPVIASGYSFFGYATTPPVLSTGMGLPLPGFEDNNPLYGPHNIPDIIGRSLSPQLPMGQSSGTLVTVPSALPSNHLMYSHTTVHGPVDALGLFTVHDLVMPTALTPELQREVHAYLEVYWDKVHNNYPIIHRPTFEMTSEVDHLDILQCAMAAIATQYLPHQEHRNNGHQIHAYAWEKLQMYTYINAQEWPLPIMQAIALCEYYARFRGRNKKAYEASPLFMTLYQMVITIQDTFEPTLATCGDDSEQWTYWVGMESRRRVLSACFLLDVHGMSYLEQPRMLDYSSPETLPVPLSLNTMHVWEAQTVEEWRNMDHSRAVSTTIGSTPQRELSAAYIAAIPAFDAALFLAAYTLQLPQRQCFTKVDLLEDASNIRINQFTLVNLFPCSPSAMAYLALHNTPLHTLLSVSGDSWVFNKKVPQASVFLEHQSQLEKWRDSGTAAVAAAFAARALNLFFGIHLRAGTGSQQFPGHPQSADISDFWGVYACALICWAFGHVGSSRTKASRPSRSTAMQWILKTAGMEPGEVQKMPEKDRQVASGAIGLARASLERECLGGRNMLLADALGVLKKLEGGDNYRRF